MIKIIGIALGLLFSGFPVRADTGDSAKNTPEFRPLPAPFGSATLEDALSGRRSLRAFSPENLSDGQISALLFAAQGITDPKRKLRSAPSAGATYPLELFMATKHGLHHYLPEKQALERISEHDIRGKIGGQPFFKEAPVSIIITAVPDRTTDRYGKRGMMYLYMEAGHAAQNILLQAVALGMGSVPVGAFNEQEVAELLEINPDKQVPLYIIAVGKPRAYPTPSRSR
ncbi:MAG: SagB/ThcOx family dehydrogenase [Chitinispirillaceae bacterium]|nr:SagB/ThcOx family dehydrogenase [Chitinispirillaceae bacterium]